MDVDLHLQGEDLSTNNENLYTNELGIPPPRQENITELSRYLNDLRTAFNEKSYLFKRSELEQGFERIALRTREMNSEKDYLEQIKLVERRLNHYKNAEESNNNQPPQWFINFFNDPNVGILALKREIVSLDARQNQRLEAFENRQNQRLEAFENRQNQRLEARLEAFENRQNQRLDARLEAFENRQNQRLDARLEAFENRQNQRLEAFENRQNQRLDARLEAFENRQNQRTDAIIESLHSINQKLNRQEYRYHRMNNIQMRSLGKSIDVVPYLNGQEPDFDLPQIHSIEDIENLTKDQCTRYLDGYGIRYGPNETIKLKERLRNAVGLESLGDNEFPLSGFR